MTDLPEPLLKVEVPFSAEGAAQLRAMAERLLALLELEERTHGDLGPNNVLVGAGSIGKVLMYPHHGSSVAAEEKVARVWGRVGLKIKAMLLLAAQLNEDGNEFSMDQLAEGLDVPVKTIRSWHRNLGRTLRTIGDGKADPEFMPGYWDGSRNQYQLTPGVREAIANRLDKSGVDVPPWAAILAANALVETAPSVAIDRAHAHIQASLWRFGTSTDFADGASLAVHLAEQQVIPQSLAIRYDDLETLHEIMARGVGVTSKGRARAYDFISRAGHWAAQLAGAVELDEGQPAPTPVPQAHHELDGPPPANAVDAALRVLGGQPERCWSPRQVREVLVDRLSMEGIDVASMRGTLSEIRAQGKIYLVVPDRYRLKSLDAGW